MLNGNLPEAAEFCLVVPSTDFGVPLVPQELLNIPEGMKG